MSILYEIRLVMSVDSYHNIVIVNVNKPYLNFDKVRPHWENEKKSRFYCFYGGKNSWPRVILHVYDLRLRVSICFGTWYGTSYRILTICRRFVVIRNRRATNGRTLFLLRTRSKLSHYYSFIIMYYLNMKTARVFVSKRYPFHDCIIYVLSLFRTNWQVVGYPGTLFCRSQS